MNVGLREAQPNIQTPDGRQVNVHWFRNQTTGQNVEFKFKYRYNDKVGNIKPTLEPKVHPSGL